jgi:hypothetical protein
MRDYAGTLPVLLEADLFKAGWNGTLNPYPGMNSKQFAMQSLRKSLLKKFCEKTLPLADCAALELFLKINSRCKEFKLDTHSLTNVEAIAIGEAKDFIHRFFYARGENSYNIMDSYSITDGFGLGNGANIGSFGTDFLSKVGTGTMAATSSSLHMLFLQAISNDPIWSDVESIRRVNRDTEVVRGSRLSFVPKTTEISRTICTEPVCNMLFQKGIANVLEEQLRKVCCIDLATQPDKNRALAQLGSITGEFGTIDLSSASDSMSLGLVREFFPRQVSAWFELTRSPLAILPDGSEVELHMVSSMGNAFTFPLQTLFFCALVYGAYRVKGLKFDRPYDRSLGNFAVFGDDIIVVREAYDLVTRLLSICGFSVNIDKSFNEGLFRESCGRDFYYGCDVRGVYIKQLLDVNDVYSAINRLNYWSAKHCIPLPSVVSYLLKGSRLMPVPFDEMDVAGVKVHSSHLRKVVRSKHTGGILYRYLHISERSFSVSDVSQYPPKLRGWINNPSAVLLAALAGTLRSGKVVTRTSRRSSRVKRRYSSRWDYIPADQELYPGFGQVWKYFVELNLNLS